MQRPGEKRPAAGSGRPAFGRMPRNLPPKAPPPLPPSSIFLSIQAGSTAGRSAAEPGKPAPASRAIVAIPAGTTPDIRWSIKNLDPKRPLKDVVVHFLIHALQTRGEALPPLPQKGSFADQVMGTDLPPLRRTTGQYRTALHRQGIYLVQIEILDLEGNRRQSAALDLEVT